MTDPPVVGASDRIREFWDADASTYDATKSHSISDPLERAAWRQVLSEALPRPPAWVLAVGAGTGSLALLAAELGYAITALDLSPGMLAEAERKANAMGLADRVTYVVGSASEPPPGPFDVVVERHVLWTIPDPVGALRSWRVQRRATPSCAGALSLCWEVTKPVLFWKRPLRRICAQPSP